MRYIVTEKGTEENPKGKVLLDMEFTTKEEVIPLIQKLFVDHNPEDLISEFVDDDETKSAPEIIVAAIEAPVESAIKTRKPRADRGQPHKVAEKSTKKVRTRGQYFVIPDNTPTFATKQELNTYLDSLEKELKVRVALGRVFIPSRNVQFTLKRVK